MGRSVIFIHGLWLHASSWGPWADHFKQAEYDTISPGWPGEPDAVEQARNNPDAVKGFGIDDVVKHYTELIKDLPDKPIAIGHSFGGLIVQRLLSEDSVAAAVALDAAPIKGVLVLPPSSIRVASVALLRPFNRSGSVSLTEGQFRYGFGNALPEDESRSLYRRWAIPSPARPLFEATNANFNPSSPAKIDTKRGDRGPLLLVAGGQDHTVPASITRATHRLYSKSGAVTDIHEFPDRGHSLGIDHGWQEVADYSLEWLKRRGF
jgi:pimeloyl-ACP methyl ester carboxylesterase